MAKVTHEFDLYGKHYALETGELAKQATGACLVRCGDSTVLLTTVVSKERRDYDFFPLTVDFIEKMYAGPPRNGPSASVGYGILQQYAQRPLLPLRPFSIAEKRHSPETE